MTMLPLEETLIITSLSSHTQRVEPQACPKGPFTFTVCKVTQERRLQPLDASRLLTLLADDLTDCAKQRGDFTVQVKLAEREVYTLLFDDESDQEEEALAKPANPLLLRRVEQCYQMNMSYGKTTHSCLFDSEQDLNNFEAYLAHKIDAKGFDLHKQVPRTAAKARSRLPYHHKLKATSKV